jgi:hypothetical protein
MVARAANDRPTFRPSVKGRVVINRVRGGCELHRVLPCTMSTID